MSDDRDWAVQFEGHEPFRLADLPVVEIQTIAARHDTWWGPLMRGPGANLAALVDLVSAVATKVGAEMPAHATHAEAEKLLDLVVDLNADLPVSWDDDGNPPGDEATTGSSSTSSVPVDGLLT